jgi:hypothetical protein
MGFAAQRREGLVLLEHLELHPGHTAGDQAQNIGRAMGQINDPTTVKGAAIVDANHSLATIPEMPRRKRSPLAVRLP